MNEHEKFVREKIEEEDFIDFMQQKNVRQFVREILLGRKGFRKDEIVANPEFKIAVGSCESIVSIDFIIVLSGINFAVIRCVNSGLDFWERYVTAFARSATEYQIPFAMVTNGQEARIINVLSGSAGGNNIEEFCGREEALNILKDFSKIPCSEKRLQKERRIIYAFEDIKHPTAKGQI